MSEKSILLLEDISSSQVDTESVFTVGCVADFGTQDTSVKISRYQRSLEGSDCAREVSEGVVDTTQLPQCEFFSTFTINLSTRNFLLAKDRILLG